LPDLVLLDVIARATGTWSVLPAIENHTLSIALGEWVIATALKQMADWSAVGFHLPVSVNLGSLQLQQPDFLHRLQTLLSDAPSVYRPPHARP
jgi:EAL domain-containing protein (putative c-di-GMP-specific phosphodiesterase class I)